jgi:elongation factor Ts
MVTMELVKELRELTGAGMLDCKKALEATEGNIEKASDWLREKGISKAAKKADRIAAEGLVDILINDDKAVILEVNSETDFVAKNDEFKNLISLISNLLINSNVTTVEEALKLPTEEGTLETTISAKIAKIGEKLSLRRFEIVNKKDNEVFGSYIHMGGKIAVLIVLEGSTVEVAKDIAMHAAAMRPKYLDTKSVPTEDLEREKEVQKQIAINEGKPADIAEKMVQGRITKFYKEVCLTEQPFVKNDDVTVSEYAKSNGGTIKLMIRYEVGEGMQKREDNFAEEVAKQMENK